MTNRDRPRRHPHSSSAHHRSAHGHSSASASGHSRARRSHHSSGRSAHHLQRQHIRIHHDDDFSFINPCVKYSLFFFNLIFWLLGAGLTGLGTWSLLQEYNENATWVNVQTIFDVVLHISLTLILIGSIVFCMSFAGCLGALRENLCLLKLVCIIRIAFLKTSDLTLLLLFFFFLQYSLKLLFLFIGEIILSTVAFMFPNSFLNYLKDNLSKDPIQNYRNDSNLRNLIDVIQMEFKCCGISDKGYKDWSGNVYFNCNSTNRSSESCAVPFSCCRNQRDIDVSCFN